MTGRLDDVQGDMTVFGSDGEEIGQVGAIRFTESGETHIGDVNPSIARQRYLQIDRGFAAALYVPEEGIHTVELGQGVILAATADEARQRYTDRPNIV